LAWVLTYHCDIRPWHWFSINSLENVPIFGYFAKHGYWGKALTICFCHIHLTIGFGRGTLQLIINWIWPNFHLGKVMIINWLIFNYGLCGRFQPKFMGLNPIYVKSINDRPLRPINIAWWIVSLWPLCGIPFIRFEANGLPFKNSLIYGFIFYRLMWLVQMKKIYHKFNISWLNNEYCTKFVHS
jgi:hypothetical protein